MLVKPSETHITSLCTLRTFFPSSLIMQGLHHEPCCFLDLIYYQYNNTIKTGNISIAPEFISVPVNVIRIWGRWDNCSSIVSKAWSFGWKPFQNAGIPLCVWDWLFDNGIVSHECQDQLPGLGMVPGGQKWPSLPLSVLKIGRWSE